MSSSYNFTKKLLDNIELPPKGKRLVIHDIAQPELALRVTDKGKKTFLVIKKHRGESIKITIGHYPIMTISQARKQTLVELATLAKGVNPNEEKKKLREETTLEELLYEYMERHSKKHKKSCKYDEKDIPRFFGVWFKRKISEISKQNIRAMHQKITEENGIYQANRMLARIRSMYNKAIEWGWNGINPAIGIHQNKEVKRDRFLQPMEFPKFFKALDEEQNVVAKNYIWMSLFTGARKSNVLAMRWDEIDFDLKMWRIPETKNGDPLNVPLITRAVEFLQSIERTSEWVFPSSTSASGHLEDPKKAWKRILDRADIKNLRIHDIRRTMGSYQAITGASLPIIGKTLGHKSQTATQIYARLDYDPVRDSMETATEKIFEYKDKK